MPTDYTKDGTTRFAALMGPQDGYGIIAGPDNTLKIVADPLSTTPVEAIVCDTNGNVTFANTISNSGASFTNATLTTPTITGTVSGTYTLAGTPTITSPAISNPSLSGTATGTYTLGGTPTITSPAISNPVLSGSATGTYTLAGTPTITSPTITTPTISSPAFSGTSTGTYTLDGSVTLSNISAASTSLVGAGSGTMKFGGTVYTNTGLQPISTAAQIIDIYTLPANSFTIGRYMYIAAYAIHAANTNNCTLALAIGGTGSIGGPLVGGTSMGTVTCATSSGVCFLETTILRAGLNLQSFFTIAQTASTVSPAQGQVMGNTEALALPVYLLATNSSAATDATAYWIIQWGN